MSFWDAIGLGGKGKPPQGARRPGALPKGALNGKAHPAAAGRTGASLQPGARAGGAGGGGATPTAAGQANPQPIAPERRLIEQLEDVPSGQGLLTVGHRAVFKMPRELE